MQVEEGINAEVCVGVSTGITKGQNPQNIEYIDSSVLSHDMSF